jgi:hypothetical protein
LWCIDDDIVQTPRPHAVDPERCPLRASLPDARDEPVTGEVIDPGYHCIMEIRWNSREDFENPQRVIADPHRLLAIKEDEAKLFATHSNPMCSVVEYDSPMGPEGQTPRVEALRRLNV